MKKLLLAAFVVVVASGSGWSKGPGCGGPGCGAITSNLNVETAQAAVAKAGDNARDYAKDIRKIPVEMAGVLTLQPFAGEPNGGKNATIQNVVAAKLKYWEEIAAVLDAARKAAVDKRRDDEDKETLNGILADVRAIIAAEKPVRAAQAIFFDTRLDQDYLAQRPEGRVEDGQQLIDRKARLYAELAKLTEKQP